LKNIILLWTVLLLKTALHSQILYINGDILTMEGRKPQYVQALIEKEGKILFVGSKKAALKQVEKNTKTVDLKGKTLLPSFIDGHSHFSLYCNFIEQANLYPSPVGTVDNIPQVIEAVKTLKTKLKADDKTLLIGFGYDQNQLAEKRHPTAADLDQAFPTNPILLVHISGHMLVANSVALKMANITAETPDPKGGTIIRKQGNKEPEGLVQESAMMAFSRFTAVEKPFEKQVTLMQQAQAYYASCGVTTMQDGLASLANVKSAQKAAENGHLYLDLMLLLGSRFVKSAAQLDSFGFSKTYKNRFRLGGLKLVTDGSPQGKTAFLSKPYLTPVEGCADNCTGQASLSAPLFDSLVLEAYKKNIQIYTHCNGDAAIDMLLNAHKKAVNKLNETNKDRRSVGIHSQIIRPDQLDAYKNYQIIPSFFTNHTYYWGDVHVSNLGLLRAHFISPLKSALDRGILFTNHSDLIVTPLDPLFILWTSVNRLSRSHVVIGKKQRIAPFEGLKALTINGAYQYFEEDRKGSLKVGKLADMVILDKNPLKVKPIDIRHIQVMETIKEGKTVFKK
jgi:predicted amidohydrolase YtcJ